MVLAVPRKELMDAEAGLEAVGGAEDEGGDDMHGALVAYVRALSGRGPARRGVWREHSYARHAAQPPRHAPRTLLRPHAPPAAADHDYIDVDTPPSPAPALPGALGDCADSADDADDDEADWGAGIAAPSAAHARLAARLLDVLRDLRLARLAVPHAPRPLRRDQTRRAAARMRTLLAPAWIGGGASWVLGSLAAHLPPAPRALLHATLHELRRACPRLAPRLPVAATGGGGPDPLQPAPPRAPPGRSPLLLWVSAGRSREDARWERRLRGLLPVRVLRGGAAPGAPERWCAQQAAGLRAALADALAAAGGGGVVLAGAGCGSALCAALAGGGAGGGGALLGVALLGPALLTAEGARDAGVAPAPAALLVCGTAAPGGRVAALEAGTAPRTRLVLLEGGDQALRLPARLRLRLRVPQEALDAAVVEEVVRWASELAAGGGAGGGGEDGDDDDNEYSHLPSPTDCDMTSEKSYSYVSPEQVPPPRPATTQLAPPSAAPRSIEIVEGRVVARVSGATPLVLPPRRTAPAAAPPPPDIMQMPIVFADDDPTPTAPEGGGLTVTSGSGGGGGGAAHAQPPRRVQYTRVIVAKRGAPPRRARAPRPARLPLGATRFKYK